MVYILSSKKSCFKGCPKNLWYNAAKTIKGALYKI